MEIGLEVLVAMTGGFGTVFTVMQWKIKQIKNQARYETRSEKEIINNQKDINQIKEMLITLEANSSDMRDRIARLEGAFNQHNTERKG